MTEIKIASVRIGFKVVEYETQKIAVFTNQDGNVKLSGDVRVKFVERKTYGDNEFTIWEFTFADGHDWRSIRGVEFFDEHNDSVGYVNLNGAIVEMYDDKGKKKDESILAF